MTRQEIERYAQYQLEQAVTDRFRQQMIDLLSDGLPLTALFELGETYKAKLEECVQGVSDEVETLMATRH